MKRRELLTGFAAAATLGALGPELQAQTAAPAAGGWNIKPLPLKIKLPAKQRLSCHKPLPINK